MNDTRWGYNDRQEFSLPRLPGNWSRNPHDTIRLSVEDESKFGNGVAWDCGYEHLMLFCDITIRLGARVYRVTWTVVSMRDSHDFREHTVERQETHEYRSNVFDEEFEFAADAFGGVVMDIMREHPSGWSEKRKGDPTIDHF